MLASDSLVIDVMKNLLPPILIAMLTRTCPTGHPYNTNMRLNTQMQFLTYVYIHKSWQVMFYMDIGQVHVYNTMTSIQESFKSLMKVIVTFSDYNSNIESEKSGLSSRLWIWVTSVHSPQNGPCGSQNSRIPK